MPLETHLGSDAVADLNARLSGTVLVAGDPEYNDVRRVHNGMIDRRPALIARPLGTADVVEALAFGLNRGFEISVRGGGHNVTGRAVCDDGLMIDLSLMKGIWVDPKARRVRSQAGVNWGEFNRATQLHGLATTGGAVSSTGIAGLTLGGGFGYLMGKYGYTIDNLLSVELVTAAGEVLNASEEENAELFWGLRGGGGNFGIATSFEYALHPVGPSVYGGRIIFDFDDTAASLRCLRDQAEDPDDEMTLAGSLTHAPGGSGRKLAAMLMCHCGDADAGAKAAAKVRETATPILDELGPITYSELNTLLDASFPRLALNYWKSVLVAALDDAVIDILTESFAAAPSDLCKLIIERPHGEALRHRADATAFPHRKPGFSILILGQWLDPAATEENIAWARETHKRLAPYAVDGAYSNYLGDDEDEARIRQAFGTNFERLQALKDRYDPDNIFHLNQNIPPSRG